jgi:hypothetical protein
MYKKVAILTIIMFAGLCSISNATMVLFSKTYINYAWLYVERGWFIDSIGNINNFNYSTSDSMYVYRNDMSKKYFDKMISLGVITGKRVSKDSLALMQSMINAANNGSISNGPSGCADFGAIIYNAYMYDSIKSKYMSINCYQSGDQWACNSSSEAKTIAKWLISIDSLPPHYCLPPDSCYYSSSVVLKPNAKRINRNKSNDIECYLNGKKDIQSIHNVIRQIRIKGK